ncbi:MAG: 2-dehydro-3-deoxygalactonokinase, partial [Firmicutes bacterium]|nr:2-dehydro-3-deoxygalactonokinase [Candidatus Colimorpha enterica]
MFFVMDMGTSNMRLWLFDGDREIDGGKYPLGAGLGKGEGKKLLFEGVRNAVSEILNKNGLTESDVDCIMASGMLGSEAGLCEVDHLVLPGNAFKLADDLYETVIPNISSIPFVIVRGLKKMNGGKLADIMRGEETETVGLSEFTNEKECVIVLPGTHNKAVRVNEKGEITDFVTMMSGEMISCAVNNTILSSAVSYRFELDEVYALKGAAASKENGVNNALFSVRVMSKNGLDTDKLTSFLYGSIIGEDIDLIKKFAGNTQIMVAGRENPKKIYI